MGSSKSRARLPVPRPGIAYAVRPGKQFKSLSILSILYLLLIMYTYILFIFQLKKNN